MTSELSADLPTPSQDFDLNMRNLKEYGYCIHDALLTPEETTALRERMDEQARMEREQGVAMLGDGSRNADDTWNGGPRHGELEPWQNILMLNNKGRVFVEVSMNPMIHRYVSAVFQGLPYHLSLLGGLILRKGAKRMPVHCDQQSLPFRTPMPVVMNIFLCLSDFDEDMGPTGFVPRTQHLPPPKIEINPATRSPWNPEPIDLVPAVCKAGSAVIFGGQVWHGNLENVSNKTRYSIATYWAQSWVRAMDNYPFSLHDDVFAQMSEAELAIHGFKTDPAGRLDPRFPGDNRVNVDRKMPFIPELRPGSDKRAVKYANFDNKFEASAAPAGRKIAE